MASYHTAPSYSSDLGQKMGELYISEANPRGLGPPPPNAYKRAVLRSPPKQFKASVLPPKKLGSGWAYGLRVVSTADDEAADRRSVSSRSASSTSSYRDYEVWRRWDDCLWFQESLELEYSIQAREKRRRLEQGKGVKKNGMYIDSKQAASFDSLPPGPDPTSVSLDIHDYIPKLTKKSTLFRANQATIDQRQQQFTSLIESLLAPQVPALIEELRGTSTVKDFFGWWRRDKDFARKHGPEKGKHPEIPILDSIPFYLDTSNPSEIFSAPTTSSRDPPRHRSKPTRPTTADAGADPKWRSPHGHSRDELSSRRRRTTPATASSSTLAASGPSANGLYASCSSSRASLYSGELSPTVVMWDGQEQLNASDRISPNAVLDAFPQTPMVRETFENIQCPPSPEADSPILGLEALPEESELELPPPQTFVQEREAERRPPVTKPRGNSVSDGRHRNAIVFAPEIALGDIEIPEPPERSPTMADTTASSRHSSLFSNGSFAPSWRTSVSDLPPHPSPRQSLDSCTTDGVDNGSPVMPQTPWCDNDPLAIFAPATKRDPRESIMSIDSIMSDASVDQVLPRGIYMTSQPGGLSVMRSFSVGPRNHTRRTVPKSVPEEEVSMEDCDDGILESYLYGIEEMEASGGSESECHSPYLERPSTSEQLPTQLRNRPSTRSYLAHPPSSREDPSSPKPITPSLKPISIKAYLTEDAIVVFRAASDTSYAEIRDRVYEKFFHQEGISLRHGFPLTYLTPASSRPSTTSQPGGAGKRPGTVGSTSTNQSSLILIQSQEVWDEVVRDSDGKLTLRVFE